MNTVEQRQQRQYLKEFLPAMVGYAIVLALTLALVDQDSASSWNTLWMLAPVLPAMFVIRAVRGWLQRADEYQRALQLEGLAMGFAAAMLASLTIGFLQVDWDPRVGGWIVYSVGMATWGTAAIVAARRA